MTAFRASRAGFLTIAAAFTAAPSMADVPDEVAFDLHSSLSMNLHHRLYRLGEIAFAISRGTTLSAMPPSRWLTRARALQAEFDALPVDARGALRPAIQAYATSGLADGNLLDHPRLTAVAKALSATADSADPPAESFPRAVRAALGAAAAAYRSTWWPADDAANRAWIGAVRPRVARYGARIASRLRAAWREPWPLGPYRVDVVRYANFFGGYTITGPVHTTISSGDPTYRGDAALEMLYHEASHGVVTPDYGVVGRALEDAATRLRVPEPDGLWHAIIFFTAGSIVARLLRDDGVAYVPYADANGTYSGGWARYREVLGAAWQPYLDGRVALEAAIADVVRAAA